jgi:hypothetical protein
MENSEDLRDVVTPTPDITLTEETPVDPVDTIPPTTDLSIDDIYTGGDDKSEEADENAKEIGEVIIKDMPHLRSKTKKTTVGFNSLKVKDYLSRSSGPFEIADPSKINIGVDAGKKDQEKYAIALGQNSGKANQHEQGIAVGHNAAEENQGRSGIAIGHNAGRVNQGEFCIAIGDSAGEKNQPDNSIILNATDQVLNASEKGLYIHPIRSASQYNPLFYNHTKNELTYYTSSVNDKTDIEDLSQSLSENIYQLSPRKFTYIPDGSTNYGFIADEVFEIDTGLVVLDGETPVNVKWFDILTYAVAELKKHKAILTALQESPSLKNFVLDTIQTVSENMDEHQKTLLSSHKTSTDKIKDFVLDSLDTHTNNFDLKFNDLKNQLLDKAQQGFLSSKQALDTVISHKDEIAQAISSVASHKEDITQTVNTVLSNNQDIQNSLIDGAEKIAQAVSDVLQHKESLSAAFATSETAIRETVHTIGRELSTDVDVVKKELEKFKTPFETFKKILQENKIDITTLQSQFHIWDLRFADILKKIENFSVPSLPSEFDLAGLQSKITEIQDAWAQVSKSKPQNILSLVEKAATTVRKANEVTKAAVKPTARNIISMKTLTTTLPAVVSAAASSPDVKKLIRSVGGPAFKQMLTRLK